MKLIVYAFVVHVVYVYVYVVDIETYCSYCPSEEDWPQLQGGSGLTAFTRLLLQGPPTCRGPSPLICRELLPPRSWHSWSTCFLVIEQGSVKRLAVSAQYDPIWDKSDW